MDLFIRFGTDGFLNRNVLKPRSTCTYCTTLKIQIYFAQVCNKWLRILETSGGRSANITGANTTAQTSSSADGRGSSGQSNHNNSFANVRGRGRGGFNRGGQRGGGSNRGGSRVIPRQPTPPATVLYC
jgi:hypothetical protein